MYFYFCITIFSKNDHKLEKQIKFKQIEIQYILNSNILLMPVNV